MLDWKSIKEKAQRISSDVSAIADEISASAKDFVADAQAKADETLAEVMSTAKNISDKAIEMWESEEAAELRAKTKDTAVVETPAMRAISLMVRLAIVFFSIY